MVTDAAGLGASWRVRASSFLCSALARIRPIRVLGSVSM
jgi:hypothetical protein